MDSIERVTKWVENKFEKIINKDLEEKITEENSTFDLETYANNLLEKYFNEDDIEKVKRILINDSYYDILYIGSENSTERSTHDSLESESNDLQNFSVEGIVKNLESESEEIRKKSLKILEACVEDLINQPSWNKIKEILQEMLSTGDRDTVNLVLKVFQKPLRCPKKPQIVSKGFTTIVEVITNQIELFNLKYSNGLAFEQIYDIKEEWLPEKKSPDFTFRAPKNRKSLSSEVLIKLMWLLIDCQQQIPMKWVRFNEVRFREIIFSFIHLLSSTNTSENTKLSGLELLSVLNPKASWCRYWCHTAVGRSLLCSALRKYKNFFIHVIEIILNHTKTNKNNKLPPVRDGVGFNKIPSQLLGDISAESKPHQKNGNVRRQNYRKNCPEKIRLNERRKYVGFAPDENKFPKNVTVKKEKKSNSEWIVKNIPRRVVTEAVFFHSISLVSCLIQFRSGRALFPVQTSNTERLLSAQNLSLSVIEYLENTDYTEWGNTGITYTLAFKTEVFEILEILKKVKAHINSSRMSADKQFPYF